ncbi:MAG: hypothetical protein PHD03_03540 [Bacilli bacterium]|nr:hypothetical protein [Bacilli bacterium]MDD4407027.1 hypothetical protein [Bacilli bacterium]
MNKDLLILLIITLSISISGVIITYLLLLFRNHKKNFKRITKFTARG